ncbi:hypothetical protein M2284_001079 [Rhodococcus sp. LBL1]|nr:hypothetical protein [Rhodococcus sp. LBL1]MDH6682826.1 hypothetical protein [Rhodococcus sp. LBL2]
MKLGSLAAMFEGEAGDFVKGILGVLMMGSLANSVDFRWVAPL